MPNFAVITEGSVHETQSIRSIPLETNDVVVFDRDYNDFKWFNSLCDRRIHFVTRLKKNVQYRIIERRSTEKYPHIYSDQVIQLTGFYSRKKCPYLLHRIRCKDPETSKIIVILTNHLHWSAQTITQIYKERWQIEIFFKSLKQQLKVKSFVDTSKNALLSQLWIALIAYLMLSYLKFKSRFNWSIYTLMEILPVNIFFKRSLWN